jgi:type I restriction enzyme S subunit
LQSYSIGTGQPNVNGQSLRSLILPLPPLAEQKRIVEQVEKLLRHVSECEKIDKNIKSLDAAFSKQLPESILQYAIQGKLVPQDPNDEPASVLLEKIKAEKQRLIKEGKIKAAGKSTTTDNLAYADLPFDIPDSWVWTRLGNVSENIHYGFTVSAQNDGNMKLLRITDIQNSMVNWESVPYCKTTECEFKTYGLHNRDIMIARTGGTIGKSYIVRDLLERAVFASYLIRVVPLVCVNEEYLKLFLETPLYWRQLQSYSIGTGQPNVNGQSLRSLILPLPPLAEQKRIVEKIEKLMSLAKKLQKREF